MALELQASPSPLPPPHPEPDPPLTPMQHHAAGESSERIPTPHSSPPAHSVAAVVVAAAQYVPPRAATRTADPADGRSWYSWSSGRTAGPPPPPPRSQPQPPPPPRQQPRAAAPPAQAPASSIDRDHRVVSNNLSRKRRAASLKGTALAARGAAAGLCLAALAVLAADSRKGWALDSYNRYSQLRYSEAVNVVGFLYSVFQFFALAMLMRRKKHLIPRPKGDYFDFIMDQVLAYLLISSSSSATARVGDWMDNWGSDPFPNMANSSIAISFLAFLVFAISSLISAYNLFRRDL